MDIPWNFLIGDDGSVYEGRGFKVQGKISHKNSVSSYDDVGIFVAFIGKFEDRQPSERMISTFKSFLAKTVNQDVLDKHFVLLMQDQLELINPLPKGLLEFLQTQNKFHSREKFFHF